jgi:hypothetical protein
MAPAVTGGRIVEKPKSMSACVAPPTVVVGDVLHDRTLCPALPDAPPPTSAPSVLASMPA